MISSFDLGIAAVTVVILVVTSLWLRTVKASSAPLPPGPIAWPVVGSLGLLGSLPHRSLAEAAKKYGPVMYMKLGYVPTIVISSAEAAKEVMKDMDHATAGRPKILAPTTLFNGSEDIAWSTLGPYWRYLRKITTTHLFTVKRLETFSEVRQEEVLAMITLMLEQSKEEGVTDVRTAAAGSSFNIITRMMMGKSFFGSNSSCSQQESIKFIEACKDIFRILGTPHISDYLPFLRVLDSKNEKDMCAGRAKLAELVQNVIEERLQVRQNQTSENYPSSTKNMENSKIFIDVMLDQVCGNEKHMTMESTAAVAFDMILAGTDTSANAIEWSLAALLKHPECMRVALEELDCIVGRDRLVEESDVPDLKYLNAVINEVFRLYPPAPLLLPRETIEGCFLGGYYIPPKSRLFVNAWAVMRDPAVFKDPETFDPSRFLDNKCMDVRGHTKQEDFGFIPFGAGRRICPGISLGQLSVQIGLAQVLQTCNVRLPDSQTCESLDMSEVVALTMPRAIPLKAVVTPRLNNLDSLLKHASTWHREPITTEA